MELWQPPKPIWDWIVFGDERGLTLHLPHEVSWLARKMTALLLRSRWKRHQPQKEQV